MSDENSCADIASLLESLRLIENELDGAVKRLQKVSDVSLTRNFDGGGI